MSRAIESAKKYSMRIFALPAKLIARFEALPRPAQLLITVGTVIAVSLWVDAAHDWRVWNQLFHPDISSTAKVRFWSALVYNLLLAMGLPVAFLVWHWRDKNARDQIENARKDINLKEFQEVQGRAAGLFDEKMPESAREQLQIAALHQLRAFLRGEYGDAFRRPAFELILAGHAEAMDRIGMPDVRRQIEIEQLELEAYEIEQIQQKKIAMLDRVMRERISIINDESKAIFCGGFPLNGKIFDLCNLQNLSFNDEENLNRSSFIFSNLSMVKLKNANLSFISFIGTDLSCADLSGSLIRQSSLHGANISHANLHSALMNDSVYDDNTKLFGPWETFTEEERADRQNELVELGAIHVLETIL